MKHRCIQNIRNLGGWGTVGALGACCAIFLLCPNALAQARLESGNQVVIGPTIDFQRQALKISVPIAGVSFRFNYRSDAVAPKWRWSIYHAYDPGANISSPGDGRPRTVSPLFAQSSKAPHWLAIGEVAIAAPDGSEVYIFNQKGDHLRTLNALTGALVHGFDYAGLGVLTAIVDGYGNATRIERDAAGFMTAAVAPHGQRTTFKNNDKGYPTSITNPLGETVSLEYGSNGQPTTFTDANKHVYRFNLDEAGLLTKLERPDGEFVNFFRSSTDKGAKRGWTTAMNRGSALTIERTPDGETSAVSTDPAGTQTQIQALPGGTTKILYPDQRTLTVAQQADPRWGRQSPLPKTLSVAIPSRLASVVSIDRNVVLADLNDPLTLKTLSDTARINGRSYTQTFDAKSRQVTRVTPAGRRSVMTLDEHGRVVKAEIPGLLPVSLSYDEQGRLTNIAQGTGNEARITTVAYNALGWIESMKDPLKRTVRFEYDAAGRVTKRVRPDGSTIALKYDANGNVTSITPPGRPSHFFQYAAAGQISAYLPPLVDQDSGSAVGKSGLWNSFKSFLAHVWSAIRFYARKLFGTGRAAPSSPDELGPGDKTYLYNKDGQLTKVLRPRGSTVEFAYDNAGRLTATNAPDAESSIAYDPKTGLQANVTSSEGVRLARSYDAALLTRLDWSGAVKGTIVFTYDNNLHTSSTSVNDAAPIKLEYDGDGLLTRAGDLHLARDSSSGLLTKTTLANVTTAEEYNEFREPVLQSAKFKDQDIFADRYERDALGRVVQKTETIYGQTTIYKYTYDLAGRLAEVSLNGTPTVHYDYDQNGNRTSYTGPSGTIKASYDEQDRLKQYGSATYAHTPDGEWLSKTVDGKSTNYHYDAFGNLKVVSLPDGTKIDYVVDGLNRRVGKKLNGKLVQGFIYQDQLKVVAELDGANHVVSRFVYATSSNAPDYMIRDGKTYCILTDNLGSPRVVVDADTGAIAQRIDYDEFGNVLRDTYPGFQPFAFAGGLYDPHTTLIRFGARDYDAATGRWTARDPALFLTRQTDLYTYASDDPVNSVDPGGMQEGWGEIVGLAKDYWDYVPAPAQKGIGAGGVATSVTGAGMGAYYTGQGIYVAAATGMGVTEGAEAVAAYVGGAAIGSTAAMVGLGFGFGYGVGSAIDAGITAAQGQSIGEANADINLGGGETAGDLARCIFSDDASGCSGAQDWWHCNVVPVWSDRPSGCGKGTGDIHMGTFDGLRYDFQAAGEFVVTQDPAGRDKIEIRLEPPNKASSITVCTALAASVDGSKVAIHLKPQPQVYINDKAVNIEPGRGIRLGKSGEIRFTQASSWIITWPDGTGARVQPEGWYLDVEVRPGPSSGKLTGLLGNADGNPTGDLVARDGTAMGKEFSSKDLYGLFGESWRVTQKESLFHYAKGESTATFTDRSVPRENVTVASLDPSARAEAERQCRAAGITATAALAECTIDFAMTGDRRFLSSAALVQAVRPDVVAPKSGAIAAGKEAGSVMVSGTGKETYNVLDPSGQAKVAWDRPTNSVTELLPGTYTVMLNNSQQRLEVTPGQQAVVRAGSLMVAGTGKEWYHVFDSSGKEKLAWDRPTNSVTELLSGTYTVMVNNSQQRVEVTPGQQAVVRAGSLMVSGTGKEWYHVFDSSGQTRLAWDRSTNSVTELLPGTYKVRLNNSEQRVEITPGQQAMVRAGSLMVSGTGKETYHVFDRTGQAKLAWDRPANSDTELLPGTYIVEIRSKTQTVSIQAGQRTTVNP
jgi:RHS repeat-associated protein